MAALDDFKAFNVDGSTVALWVFRSTIKDGKPIFSARWIDLTDELEKAIKAAIVGHSKNINETIEYGILAQNNEGSVLTIPSDETYAHLISQHAANEVSTKRVGKLKHLENIDFYAVKLTTSDKSLFAVKKSDNSWKSRISRGFLNVVFSNDTLDINRFPTFNISPNFDFYVMNDNLLISSKPNFESVLAYREAHVLAFDELKAETEFKTLFSEMGPIISFVGTNKMHLRRAIAIQQKGYYKNPSFMKNLKKHCKSMSLMIEFDNKGQIIPTADNCRHIFQALLDHRLDSRLTNNIYDAQNTEAVR